MKDEKISTGSFDLNKWLFGGYETDVVTMIAGPPGSGKTNMCILVACSQAKKGNKVIFVDTEGGFSVERIKQIVDAENADEVLKNIFLLSPTGFDEQKKAFSQLLDKIKSPKAKPLTTSSASSQSKGPISLIVIDGMATLYRLEIGSNRQDEDKIKEINWKMAEQMRILSEIARKQKIPVVITNQVYSGYLSEEEMKKGIKKEMNLVGGDLLKYWSKCIIELQQEGKKKRAVLLKHRSMPQKEMSFEIKDKGIFRKGWI